MRDFGDRMRRLNALFYGIGFAPICTLLLLVFVSALVACTGLRSVINPISEGVFSGSGVDAYISSDLSAHDRSVMKRVMLLLRREQWQNVVFFDAAGDGRIYANRPELLKLAFLYQPVPGQPGMYEGPEGETLMLPPNPPPQRVLSISPQSGLPLSDSTGPFYRLFILDGTSWTANAVTPAFWPGPTPVQPWEVLPFMMTVTTML
jgi:hypothetical protein